MNLRPRPGLTLAVAAALAGTAPLSTPAAADEPLVEHCYTVALTDEEVAAGAVSEIDCYEVPADSPTESPMARGTTITFAIVYDTDASGSFLAVSSPAGVITCTGGTVVFGTGNTWDNRISATDLVACGSAKHWSNDNFTGSNQLVTGAGFQTITGTMNNATSSIAYAP